MKRISNLYSTGETFVFNSTTERMAQTTSKGNQIKWLYDSKVYKADALGYEGLAEAIVSEVLHESNIETIAPIVDYKVCKIIEEHRGISTERFGCYSDFFLEDSESLITIDMLFTANKVDTKKLYSNNSGSDFIKAVVDTVESITGLSKFGAYLTALLEIDAVVLNVDRHFNNIAVVKTQNNYRLCDVFDNGASLLSDVTKIRSVGAPIEVRIPREKAKPFLTNFEKQAVAAERLYGKQLVLTCDPSKINRKCLNKMTEYPEWAKERAMSALLYQLEKYYPIYGK